MRDVDVRKVLFGGPLQRYMKDGHSRIVEELSLCQGDARIDVAVVNGKLHGFEIKSDRDTLERLPGQVTVYSKVFDNVTLVTGETHLEKSLHVVPEWWGVSVVVLRNKTLRIKTVRRPKQNSNIDVRSVVQLLWKNECQALLARYGIESKSFSKSLLWDLLVEELEPRDICINVREMLKQRKGWREGVERQRPPRHQSTVATYVGPLISFS